MEDKEYDEVRKMKLLYITFPSLFPLSFVAQNDDFTSCRPNIIISDQLPL